jgi:hypothetical protein
MNGKPAEKFRHDWKERAGMLHAVIIKQGYMNLTLILAAWLQI